MAPESMQPGTVPHSALSYLAAEAAETARLAARVCQTPIAVARVDGESGAPVLALIGLDGTDAETVAALSTMAHSLVAGSAVKSPRPLGLRHAMAAPVATAAGPVMGFLLVASPEPREQDPSDEATLRTLARRLAETLDLRRQARVLRSAEAALNRARANFSTLVEGLDSGLLLEDDERQVVLVNRSFLRRFAPAIDGTEIEGRPTLEVFARMAMRFRQPEDFVALANPERRSRQRQLGQPFETTDGRTLEIDSLPVLGQDGTGHIYQFRDVSERVSNLRSLDTWFQVSLALVMAGDAVDASERVLRTLIGGLGFRAGSLWEVHPGGGLTLTACWTDDPGARHAFSEASLSPSFETARDVLGRCAALGQPLWISSIAEAPGLLRADVANRLGLRSAVLTPVRGDNQVMGVLELLDAETRDQDTERARVIAGAADQLGQFLARQRAVSRVRSSEARFRAVVETIDEGLLLCDTNGVIVDLNPAARRLLERSGEDLIGTAFGSYLGSVRFDAMVVERGMPVHETPARRTDGSEFPASVLVHPIVTDEGRLLVAHVRDLSARQEIDRLKKRFVATVSHELRTPLTSIRASLGLLALGAAGELPPQAEKIVAIAERSTERLVGLINDIIDLERAEGGHLKLRVAKVDANEIVRKAIEAVSPLAIQDSMALVSAEVAGVVAGDEERLTQVLVNFLSNALKFAPRGSRVTVTARPEGEVIRFAVADEGPGIPDSVRLVIFEPFRQLESSDSRGRGGSGLGLAICKSIVEQHGGSIGVTPGAAGGSIFFFTVPAVVQNS